MSTKPRKGEPFKRSESARKPKKDKSEAKYYGEHACLALIEKRREDVIRAYVTEEQVKPFKSFLHWCAQERKAYHIVSHDEMQRIFESVHHQGIGLLAKEATVYDSQSFFKALAVEQDQRKHTLIYLAGTSNPHNVGAILRTAAHFGIRWVLCDASTKPRLSGALARVSKGGSEVISLVSLEEPTKTLEDLRRKGYELVATSSHSKQSVFDYQPRKKLILALGNESAGLSKTLSKLADVQLTIPGSGAVESLNVSVACGVILGAWSHRPLA